MIAGGSSLGAESTGAVRATGRAPTPTPRAVAASKAGGGATGERHRGHYQPTAIPDIGERPWLAQAACKGHTSLFYPPQVSGRPTDWAPAQTICNSCPVRSDCLDWAVEHHETHGCWGGRTPEQRRQTGRERDTRRSA